MKNVSVIVVAAGEGKRFGLPKQFALLRGKSVLDWCLEAFESHEDVSEVILVLKEDAQNTEFTERFRKISSIAQGGDKRQDSVLSGFRKIDPEKARIVLVHDGVRPLVSKELIDRIIEAAQEKEAAVPAVPLMDTVKIVDEQVVTRTLDRDRLFLVQTPQGFLYSTLKVALEESKKDAFYGTDEASLVERIGKKVVVVQGDPKNIKITTPEDIKIAEAFLED